MVLKGTSVAVTVVVIALFLHVAAAPRPAQAQAPAGEVRVTLPFEVVDVLDGAKFKIRVPKNWNGTLLVYLPGSRLGAPPPEPVMVPPALPGSQPPLEETLLLRGYALAASEIGSWEMPQKESLQDGLTLTGYFRGRVGEPARVILWGTSAGGLAALKMIEDYPRTFAGAIAACASGAGLPRKADRALDWALAYDAAFGWPTDKWGPLEDPRPGLLDDSSAAAALQVPNSSNRGSWEFLRLVVGIPLDGFWNIDPAQRVPGWQESLSAATVGRSTWNTSAAGPVAQNLDRHYKLTPEEKAYLAGLGINADALLAKMNARTNIRAAPWARDYVERFGRLRGKLLRPTLTLHNTVDPINEVAHERAYRAQVAWWGHLDRLVQVYVKAIGHCAFTSEQLLATLAAMERWLDTGTRPDASFFPEEKGFDDKFVPPPWPY